LKKKKKCPAGNKKEELGSGATKYIHFAYRVCKKQSLILKTRKSPYFVAKIAFPSTNLSQTEMNYAEFVRY
jgi:hypothetical protein